MLATSNFLQLIVILNDEPLAATLPYYRISLHVYGVE